jgi:hypothetical protein
VGVWVGICGLLKGNTMRTKLKISKNFGTEGMPVEVSHVLDVDMWEFYYETPEQIEQRLEEIIKNQLQGVFLGWDIEIIKEN